MAAGTATITATAYNQYHTALHSTCAVTVNDSGEITKTKLSYTYDDYIENNAYQLSNCPLSGNPKLLVIPVWFTDSSSFITTSKKENVQSDIEKAYIGSTSDTGWNSVKTFYKAESKDKMVLNATVSEWYECGKSTSTYYTDGNATQSLVTTATNWYFSNHSDAKSNYDTNKDGYYDGIMLIYGAPDNRTWGKESYSNLWAYCYWIQQNSGTSTNPNPNVYFWASYDFMYSSSKASERAGTSYGGGDTSHCSIDAHTYIHEMGHVLGLEDYYDYGPSGLCPSGGFSMQDYNVGGHDPYSVMAFGWADPYIPNKSMSITIGNFQDTHDLILLANHTVNSPFDEYLLLELYTPTGLNKFDSDYSYRGGYPQGPSTPGIRLWHIDARLTYAISDESWSTNLKTNPGYGNVYHAMSNTYDDSDYGSVLGSDYYDYNILQLIRNNYSSDYRPSDELSASALFTKSKGSFSMSSFSGQFVNSGKMNDNKALGWSFTITSLSSTSATINLVKA